MVSKLEKKVVDYREHYREHIRVYSLWDLKSLVSQKRSVVCPTWVGFMRPRPAAFVMNMTGDVLLRMFDDGMYVYEKVERKPK